jgi:hypothetical protein
VKSLSEKSFQGSDGHTDSLIPDLLAMITELRAERTEIDEAIEMLERVRSSKLLRSNGRSRDLPEST